MSWVTAIYATVMGASATIAVPNLLVGIWQRRGAQLFFVGLAIGTIGLAAGELAMMYATSVQEYARALKWVHLPIFVGFISVVGFVYLYFGTGRLWLGLIVCGLRVLCLIINFISPLNLNFREITGLDRIPLLGEMVSTANGLASHWNYLSQVTSLLLVGFVIDASISLWRKKEPRDRRRAVTVGGSIVFFVALSALSTALFYLELSPAPYFLSVCFFAIVCAMAVELGYNLFVAGLAEQEIRESRDEISRLSRISLLGEMTAAIAHELRQPLSGISNNASAGQRFIDKGCADNATLRDILVDIEANVHRADDIIRNIRNTVKKGAALRQRINLSSLITQVGRMLRPDARAHRCEVKIFLPRDLPSVLGDPLQIQQVLINLVGNAFEAMLAAPPGNRIVEISAEQQNDGMVSVSVRDHGIGISDEARERIFDQFFTTKEEGLGMGLAIVRSVVEAHGGKIKAENLDGAGARFSFTLPTRLPPA